MRILIILLSLILTGCGTPGIMCKIDGDRATFAPVAQKGVIARFFPASLPAGAYTVEKTADGLKASADSRVDLRVVDLNMLKGE